MIAKDRHCFARFAAAASRYCYMHRGQSTLLLSTVEGSKDGSLPGTRSICGGGCNTMISLLVVRLSGLKRTESPL